MGRLGDVDPGSSVVCVVASLANWNGVGGFVTCETQ